MDLPIECEIPPKKFLNRIYSRIRAFPLAGFLYCAPPLYLSHDNLSPIGCYPPLPRVGSSQDQIATLKLGEFPNQLFSSEFSV